MPCMGEEEAEAEAEEAEQKKQQQKKQQKEKQKKQKKKKKKKKQKKKQKQKRKKKQKQKKQQQKQKQKKQQQKQKKQKQQQPKKQKQKQKKKQKKKKKTRSSGTRNGAGTELWESNPCSNPCESLEQQVQAEGSQGQGFLGGLGRGRAGYLEVQQPREQDLPGVGCVAQQVLPLDDVDDLGQQQVLGRVPQPRVEDPVGLEGGTGWETGSRHASDTPLPL